MWQKAKEKFMVRWTNRIECMAKVTNDTCLFLSETWR